MSDAIVYEDAYLKKFCTSFVENRAADYVTTVAGDYTFSAEWTAELTKLRTYILAARENQGQPDDLFAEKIKVYSKEFDSALVNAKIDAAATAETDAPPIFTIPLERN